LEGIFAFVGANIIFSSVFPYPTMFWRPTLGFSGSGGSGKTHMQTRTIAGKARRLRSGVAAVRLQAGVGQFLVMLPLT